MSSETQKNPLTDHAYDGIQEFDNPLPGWWKWMFVATIVFSVFYAMYFHIGAPGRTIQDQYGRALAQNTLLQFGGMGELEANEETILEYMPQAGWVKVGQVVFKTNCISCHGRDGEGKVGPNLTDNFYKNARDLEGLARVISNGAGNGAMPAWANRLHPNEIVMVTAYVASLRGTTPAGEGKAPEGTEIDPWPDPPAEVPEEADADSANESAAG